MKPAEIQVTIGVHSQRYQLWKTAAPQGSDYSYVLQLYTNGEGDIRYVLIPIEHVEYQTLRYQSFLNNQTEPSDELDEHDISDRLYHKMRESFQ